MDFVYSQSPWVLPKDPEGTEKIFTEHGWKVTFNDHEVIPFGLEKRVYFIRKGLFATLAGGAGDFSRMVGLFRPAPLWEPSALSHSQAMRCP